MILNFDVSRYSFDKMVASAICDDFFAASNGIKDLGKLHHFVSQNQIDDIFSKMYNLFRTDQFQEQYDLLCGELISEMFDGNARYQSIPSARIQLPNAQSVNFHTDQFYGHGSEIRNFWLPLTKVSGENSMYVVDDNDSVGLIESMRNNEASIVAMNQMCIDKSKPLSMLYGDLFCFHSSMLHGTVVNQTDSTRVSFDFRMVLGGSDIGLKDQSFFIVPGTRNALSQQNEEKESAGCYFSREGIEELVPSQKYQQIICLQYCQDNGLAPTILETELSGFDHLPSLWNLINGTWKGKFDHLVIYSRHNLLKDVEQSNNVLRELKKQNITTHFVFEDEVIA